jgi:hypothetical protein
MATQWDDLPRVLVDGESVVDWNAVGMELLTHDPETGDPLTVSKDKNTYKGALLLRVKDLTVARQHLGDEPIVSALDGSSFRVAEQDVNRAYLVKCATEHTKPVPLTLQRHLWNRLIGIRRKTEIGPRKPVIVEVKVITIMLPNGATWVPTPGDDAPAADQLRSAWLSTLMDSGVEKKLALGMTGAMNFQAMIDAAAPKAE